MGKNRSAEIPSRLFLIGYRGCGKSTVARLLADRLGWDYLDSDHQIEQQTGKTIATIFAEAGESAFRDSEEQVVAELCERRQTVIALGGGAVLRESTRERLQAAGPVVWLTARAETLAERIAGDAASPEQRPNLTQLSGLDEVRHVLAEREPIYRECATFAVDAEGRSPETIAVEIADWMRED